MAKGIEEPELPVPKAETNSPPLSNSDDDDDETEGDSSDDEEEQGGPGGGAGGGSGGGGPPLKKGPWTPEEDKRLKEYVVAHGEGNWNQVQINSGLNRCGKSCRLRWANHLRPNLKKGPIDEEEELRILELHSMMGNKWAKMAASLPGRTDNEIKNFWNTRSKRLIKAGTPLYPPNLLARANQDPNCESTDNSRGKKRPNELSQGNGFVINDIVFEKIDYIKEIMKPSKRHASSGIIVSGYNGSPTRDQFPDEPEKTCYSTDFNFGITKNQSVPFGSAIASGQPILNGNISTSGTLQRPMKMELPSLQYSDYDPSNSWLFDCPTASPIRQIQSPASVSLKPECMSSQNTGLLDALVYEGHALGDPAKSQGFFDVSGPPVSCDQVLQSNAYPMSSSSSVFSDSLFECNSLDEFQTSKSPSSLDALFGGSKHHADTTFPDNYLSPWVDSWKPDASSEARFLNEESPYQSSNSTLDGFLHGVSCEEVGLSVSGHSRELGLESCHWNSMPGAYQLPEFPDK